MNFCVLCAFCGDVLVYTVRCAGHTPWKAATKLGLKTVPVLRVDSLTAERFIAFNIADNQTASLAMWEESTLKELLDELRESNTDLADLGFSDTDLRKLFSQDDAVVESNTIAPSTVEAKTRKGDLIALGEHRVLCSDSRDQIAVQ